MQPPGLEVTRLIREGFSGVRSFDREFATHSTFASPSSIMIERWFSAVEAPGTRFPLSNGSHASKSLNFVGPSVDASATNITRRTKDYDVTHGCQRTRYTSSDCDHTLRFVRQVYAYRVAAPGIVYAVIDLTPTNRANSKPPDWQMRL